MADDAKTTAAQTKNARSEQMCEFALWSKHSLGRPTVRLYRHYAAYMDHELAQYGISAAHVPLLGYLWEGAGSDTQNEIANSLGVDKATVSRTVAYLVRAGLVVQSVSSRDSRAFTVELTEAGEQLCGPVGAILRAWTNGLTEGMEPEALDTFLGSLETMLERASAMVKELEAPKG